MRRKVCLKIINYIPVATSIFFIMPAIVFLSKAHEKKNDKSTYYVVGSILVFLCLVSSLNHLNTYEKVKRLQESGRRKSRRQIRVERLDWFTVVLLTISGLFLPLNYNFLFVIVYALGIYWVENTKVSMPYKRSILHSTIHFYVALSLIFLAYTDI